MVKNEYWAKPMIVREQQTMFAPTLEDMISDDHEVRLLDELLRQLDWSDWEAHYSGWRGQPPIHPRVLAGIWLYALMRRMRTSRPVEYACGHNVDFIWLAEGLVPDHSTLAEFFSKFRKELKSLFKQVCKIAMTMGLVRLGEVAFDGTRVKASNPPVADYRTLTTATIQERLQTLDQQIEQMLAEVQTAEAAAAEVRGGSSGTKLPSELADLTARRDKLQEALAIAKTLDEARRADGIDPAKNPAQVPMTDLDSRVMPNKEGGYAPNYTPTCLTDGTSGFILDATVVNLVNEHPEALPAVDRATEQCGETPENFLADGGMATGPIMAGLELREIERTRRRQPRAPRRPDSTRAGRVVVEAAEESARPARQVVLRVRAGTGRIRLPEWLRRDEHEEVRQRTAARMASESARQLFNRRSAIAETPFGYLKGVLGLRQFRHRGQEKVDHEWRWACLSLNLKKLLRALAHWRALSLEALLGESQAPALAPIGA